MDRLAHNGSVIGKNFDYWQILYDKAIVEKHANNLQLSHLNYAIDRRFITNEKYIAHRSCITDQPSQSGNNYKPHTLMDFGGLLKKYSLKIKQEKLYQPLFNINKHLEEKNDIEQTNITCVTKTSENILQQNKANYDIITDKEVENINNPIKKQKKSRKRRKKKKNVTISEVIDHSDFDSIKQQTAAPRHQVKIFTRTSIKKYASETIIKEPISSTKTKTLREIYSKILKQFKEEKKLLLLQH